MLEVKRTMNDSYDNIITICNTFGLEMDCIESCTSIVRNKQVVIDLKLTDKRPPCPECGNESVKIKGYVAKKINHSILNDKGCILVYHARRFVCPICHTTYYEFNPFVFKRMKITSTVIQCVMRDLTKPSETFVSIAERYHISPTTVASIFDATVNIPRAKLPRIMSTDENYAFYSKDTHSKYVCVLIDQQTGRPIDILPSRRYDYLDEYYSKIPKYEKDQVEFIATDMYDPYRRIIHKHFKHSLHVVDRYHVAQELNRKVDSIRLRIMKPYGCINYKDRTQEQKDAYYLLKHQNRFLFKHFNNAMCKDKKRLFDITRKRYYNAHFRAYLNPYDIAQKLVSIHPDINKAWELKDEVTDFYVSNTVKTAPEAIETVIKHLRESNIEELVAFSKTMSNWKVEIINSFCISKAEYNVSKDTGEITEEQKRINNALMENRNAIIKLVTKAANGYRNWERFRNRCMLVLEKGIDFEIDKDDGSVKMVEKMDPDN